MLQSISIVQLVFIRLHHYHIDKSTLFYYISYMNKKINCWGIHPTAEAVGFLSPKYIRKSMGNC